MSESLFRMVFQRRGARTGNKKPRAQEMRAGILLF
nr:MAG TPA: hypothetical protein [Caudoviricetes sp.]DAZ64244.1 MAG TPA: hypothetical protein [Caudoviricetes sp.]